MNQGSDQMGCLHLDGITHCSLWCNTVLFFTCLKKYLRTLQFFLHYFRSAFVPVAPSTHSLTTYPSFLTGLPHPATAAASAAQQQLLTGTISVYSDLLQHQLTRSSEAMHGHSNILNNSLGHTSTEDELDSSGASRRQSKSNKKQSKQRNSKVKYLPYNYVFILVIDNLSCMFLEMNLFLYR